MCVSWIGGSKNNHAVTFYDVSVSVYRFRSPIIIGIKYEFINSFAFLVGKMPQIQRPMYFHCNGKRYGITFRPRKKFSGEINLKTTLKLLDVQISGEILAYWSRDSGTNRYSHNKYKYCSMFNIQASYSIIPDICCHCAHFYEYFGGFFLRRRNNKKRDRL